MPQFDRFFRLLVGQPNQTGLLIEDLKIQFAVKKTETPEPNTAVITIYNLEESRRNRLGTTGDVATLQVGYVEQSELQRIICEMDVIDAQSIIAEPDVSTVLICQDGGNALRTNKQSKSFIAGKSVKDIVAEVVKDAGLTLRDMSQVADDAYHNGFSESGPLADIMNKLAGKLNARWSIQNGEVQMVPIGQAADESVILVSPETGLVGSPQRRNKVGQIDTPGQKDGWVARSLSLQPIEPGSKVKLVSRAADGVFKCVAVEHKGDTHGQEWYTDMELEEIG